MHLHDLIHENRDGILKIAMEHGARQVRIIGSVARGEADCESDIDFLVDFESGRTLLDHAALTLDLQNLLGIKVDVATERGLKARVRSRVLQEAVPL